MNEIIITPLGTISPYPKKDMNCPGFLIEYNNEKILAYMKKELERKKIYP